MKGILRDADKGEWIFVRMFFERFTDAALAKHGDSLAMIDAIDQEIQALGGKLQRRVIGDLTTLCFIFTDEQKALEFKLTWCCDD